MAYAPGRYMATIKSQGFAESQKKKTPFAFLTVVPDGRIDPVHPDGELMACDQYERDLQLWVNSDANAKRTIESLQGIGWGGSTFRDFDPETPDCVSLVGTQIEVSVVNETRGEKTYDRFQLPWTGRESTQSDSSLAKRLDTLYSNGAKPKQRSAPKPTDKPLATSAVDQDIPF